MLQLPHLISLRFASKLVLGYAKTVKTNVCACQSAVKKLGMPNIRTGAGLWNHLLSKPHFKLGMRGVKGALIRLGMSGEEGRTDLNHFL